MRAIETVFIERSSWVRSQRQGVAAATILSLRMRSGGYPLALAGSAHTPPAVNQFQTDSIRVLRRPATQRTVNRHEAAPHLPLARHPLALHLQIGMAGVKHIERIRQTGARA